MRKIIFFIFISLLVTGCFDSEDSDTEIIVDDVGSVEGRVTDSISGLAISEVYVSIGSSTAITDSNAVYALSSVGVGLQSITASKEGYVAYSGVANVIRGDTIKFNISITPLELPEKSSFLSWDNGSWDSQNWQ